MKFTLSTVIVFIFTATCWGYLQDILFKLTSDIIHQQVESEPAVHDVGIARVHNSILRETQFSLLPCCDVTYRFLNNCRFQQSNGLRKLSLLLLDDASFKNAEDLNRFTWCLAESGLWSFGTTVVVFSRSLPSIDVFDSFGTVNLLTVQFTESRIQTYLLDFLTGKLLPMPYNSAVRQLFSAKMLNVKGYQFGIHMGHAIPFHKYRTPSHVDGIDVELIEIVIFHMNGTVFYSKDYTKLLNWITQLGEFRQVFDLSFYHMERFPDTRLDRLYLPFREDICISVPKRRQRILFQQLTRPFDLPVWILIGCLTCLRMVQNLCPQSICDIIKKYRKFLLASLLLLEFVLVEAYLVKVMAYLASMQYEPNPKTLADLDQRGQKMVAYENEVQILTEYPNLELTIIASSQHNFFRTHACFVSCKAAEFYVNSKHNLDPITNDRVVVLLKERPITVARYFSFVRFSPFVGRFRECIDRLVAAGVWEKVYNRWSNSREQFELLLDADEAVLKFEDLRPLWILITIGSLIAVCVFVVEWWVFMLMNPK